MKIINYSYSFHKGGAAIAAKKFADIAMAVGFDVEQISQDNAGYYHFFLRLISYFLGFFQRNTDPVKHSLNLFSYAGVIDAMSCSDDAVHHFHWINNDTLSVYSFNKIPRNSILTLHDEWLYCSTEHYCDFIHAYTHRSDSDAEGPFVNGYFDCLLSSGGINWKRIIWQEKYKHLSSRDDIVYTVPSRWLYNRAKSSRMLAGKDIRLLPNPIDVDLFSPSDDQQYRYLNGIDSSDIVITFGAINGAANPVKGALLLEQAICMLPKYLPVTISEKITLLMFGGSECSDCFPFRSLNVGRISDPSVLAKLYASSDCVIVPSYVESFGQVAAEAQSCGIPVIAFATSGLTDVVIDKKTGFLAAPFSTIDLAEKIIHFLLLSAEEKRILSVNARKHIVDNFSYEVISEKYVGIIEDVSNRD